MYLKTINRIIQRELNGLRKQLLAYPKEEDIWKTPTGIMNSAGNLALHIVGNLRHYIGAHLGRSGYIRNREEEFKPLNLPRKKVLEMIGETKTEVKDTLALLGSDILDKDYPQEVGGVIIKTEDFLFHLITHLSYHLGQIDYHRRLITGTNVTVGMLSISELKAIN